MMRSPVYFATPGLAALNRSHRSRRDVGVARANQLNPPRSPQSQADLLRSEQGELASRLMYPSCSFDVRQPRMLAPSEELALRGRSPCQDVACLQCWGSTVLSRVEKYNFTMLNVRQILVSAVGLALVGVGLTACGLKGPLRLPTEPAARNRATLPELLTPGSNRTDPPTPAPASTSAPSPTPTPAATSDAPAATGGMK